MAKHADYEYRVNGKTLRVARRPADCGGGWCWYVLETGRSSNDIGVMYTKKHEAKADGFIECYYS